MATLIKSKQIEGVVTASVVEGGFIVSGSQNVTGPITASTFVGDGSNLTGINYSQIENQPIFRAGTNVTITTGSLNGSTTYTINSTGGSGGGGSTDISYLNQATESLQYQIDAIVSATSSFITSDNTGSDSQTLTIVGNQLTISNGNTITLPISFNSASFATTGSNTFIGNQYFSGSLIPESSTADDGIHSLGSVTNPWKELYISTSSLNFVDGEGVVKKLSLSDLVTFDNHDTLGSISSSAQISALGFISESTDATDISALNQFSSSIQSQVDALIASTSSYLTSESDNQTLTIVGDQLTISDGNTITIPTGSGGSSTDISSLNEFTSSIQSQVDGLSSVTSSYLTELPTGIMSGSEFTDFSSSVHTELQNIQHTDISSLNDYTSSNDLNISELQSASSSFQSQLDGLSSLTSSYLTSETDSQTLSIDGNQLTISDGNTITIPTGSSTDNSLLNEFTSSAESRLSQLESQTGSYLTSETDSQTLTIVGDQLTISDGNTITIPTGSGGGVSSWNDLTDIPTELVSGSVLRTLDGTTVLSASVTFEQFSASLASEFENIQHTQIPQGTISSSQQILDLGFVTSSDELILPNGLISSSQQLIDLGFSTTDNTGSDSQTLTIVGNQLTISDGNTITIPTGSDVTLPSGLISSSQQILDLGFIDSDHTDITQLNQFTQSIQSQVDGLSSATSSYLTELPSGLVSGSILRTLDGTDVISGSILPGTGITIDSSSGDYVITATDSGVSSWNDLTDIPNNIISGSQQISDLGFVTSSAESEFDGNRVVSNTLLGDLYSQSFNAGTSGSLRDFIEATFFPSYAPTATFTDQTAKFNTNLATDGTNLVSISVSDTVDDSPYIVTLSGTDSNSFIPTPTNADSSSWELRANGNLSSATYSYNVIVTDKNSASRTYSDRSLTIAQADNGTLTPTGTFYIIESATTGPIYLSSTGRNGSQGGVTVAYSPNYGAQVATNFTSTNSLISVNSTSGLLSVGSPISGSGNVSGSVISTTIGWEDQYGNTDSSNININVSKNNAPDIIFTNTTANLNTNTAKLNGGTLVTLSFSDIENDAINHNSFQFTDTSGQLTATKSGNNYLVTANSNLSGSRSYGITASIEDIHGFRSNIESSSFSIVQGGNGTLSGDTSIYIIESALTNAVFRDATGFGNGNTAQVSVTYSPSAGSQTVSSYSSTNPAILIDSSGNLTLGVDLSGSVTQSGDTFTSTISFQDQYGNVGSGSVTAYVFANNAPSVSFVSSSNYTTDTATSGSNSGVITISDTETNSPYIVVLGGTDGSKFTTVSQNVATSSVQIQPTGSLSSGTYSVDITITDTYGKFSTLSNKSIVVDSVADTYGTIYVYTHNLGPAGAWSSTTYNGIYGISTVNSDTPAEVTSFTTPTSLLGTLVNNDVIGDNTITFNSSYTMTLRDTISGDTTLDSALDTDGSILTNGTSNIFLLYPSGSDMSVPTSIQETINGVNGGVVPYLNVDSAGWGIASAKLNSITLGTPHLGYSEWFVLGRMGTNGVGTSLQYRLINSNGGNAPI